MFFYLKNYIYLYSMKKKNFCYVNILSLKENTFIFNQNIFALKDFYFHPGFLCKKKCLFNQKLMRSMNFFYSRIFGSQIWSSIC